MDKKPKDAIADTEDESVKTFVRPGTRELDQDDLEHVAGGVRGHWDPDG